ncbi:MAG: hypothetical protein P4L35_10660, partial [Ignavibacteriaceae bacterium]|nr:hypothetical protein [Ignavibacteriaceae bacterium]
MKKLILLALFLFLVPFSGTSFTQWHQTLSPVVGSVFCLTSDSTRVFAGADSGVYITTDNGVNWAQTNNGLSKSAFV